MSVQILTAVIIEEDDLFIGYCPETELISQGESEAEALDNLREITKIYLEVFPTAEIANSKITTFEVSIDAD